jgi:hypothetical protein
VIPVRIEIISRTNRTLTKAKPNSEKRDEEARNGKNVRNESHARVMYIS